MAKTEDSGYIVDKVVKAEKRIKDFPYDTEAWAVLIRDAQMRKIDTARVLFERLLEHFPNCGKFLKIYIEQELKSKNFERVEKLFQRCLIKVLNMDLWKLYLSYIKETKSNLASYREKMAQAYDFALEKIGMDLMSYSIWADYIIFLKSVEAVGSYAENQRISAVRKVYHRGIVNPMIHIEHLWRDYCTYENSINALIAKKMIEERGRDYNTARRVSKEYEAFTRGLDKNAPSVPPQNAYQEIKQVELWKRYINWEKCNPLKTEEETLITRRVMFAYEQCLLCLGHHSDIWFEAASFLEQSSKVLMEKGDQNPGRIFADEAAAIYERSTTSLMKSNMLLYFAYADFEETRMKHDKVHQIYKRLLEREDIEPTLAYIHYMKFARRAEGIKSARLVFKSAREDKRSKYHVYVAAALMEYYCSKEKSIALKIFELGLKRYADESGYALCYIDFMSHLNEDNNTRVLFERVLSSGNITAENSTDIWSRFLAFESQVGDLSSIVKVEKRRVQAIEKTREFQGKETAMLIDRYKYRDILPCTPNELKSIGYKAFLEERILDMASSHTSSILAGPFTKKVAASNPAPLKKPTFPVPDVHQMLPFKPRITAVPGSHPIPGGVFPPPPAAAALLQILPPPQCFSGPHVIVDKLIDHMMKMPLPSGPIGVANGTGGQFRLDPGTQLSMGIASGSKKRKHAEGGDSDEEGANNQAYAPVRDIYRCRQQKRVK